MTDRFPVSWPRSRGEWVVAVTVAGLLAGWAISLPAWLSGRTFPFWPLAEVFVPFPQPWDGVFLGLASLCLLAAALLPERRWPLFLSCGAAVWLALQDQTRWQPWFYQYLLTLALAAAAKRRDDPALLAAWRLLLVATYFWSGLHKLGPGFANLYDRGFIGPLAKVWPEWLAKGLGSLSGPVIPWLEMGIAVALCVRRLRAAGVWAAVGMHLMILLMLGPFGSSSNAVVWPWNLAMAALVPLLFHRVTVCDWRTLFLESGFRIPAAVLAALVLVAPAFSSAGWWDRYLSFQMYSGTDRRLMVVMDPPGVKALPEAWRKGLRPSAQDPALQELRFAEWAFEELRIPFPTDQRMLTAVGRKCAEMDFTRAGGRIFFYTDFAFLMKERGWAVYSPEQMKTMRRIPPFQKP